MGILDRLHEATKAAALNAGQLYQSSAPGISTGFLAFPGWADRDPNGRGIQSGPQFGRDDQRVSTAWTSSWVYSDIMAIAKEASAAPLIVKQRKGEDLTDIENHPLEVLWGHPNPDMGRSFLTQAWVISLQSYGEAYLYLAPAQNGKQIQEIWPVPASRMTPVVGDGAIKEYNFSMGSDKPPLVIPRQFIVYSRLPHPKGGTRGLSPIAAAMMGIETDLAQAKWNKNFFGPKNGVPSAAAILPAGTTQTEFLRTKQEILDTYGSGNREIAVVRSGDLDFKMLGISQRDMDFISGRSFSRDEIDRAFGIPAGYWQASATEANARHAKAVLIEQTVWPLLELLAEDLNAQYIPNWGNENDVVEFEDIRPRNIELDIRVMESHKTHWTINELREEDGKDPFPEEDPRGEMLVAEVVARAKAGSLGNDDPASGELPDMQGGDGAGDVQAGQGAGPDAGVDTAAGPTDMTDVPEPDVTDIQQGKARDMRLWRDKAIKRLRAGKSAACDFTSSLIAPEEASRVKAGLGTCTTPDEVKRVFAAPAVKAAPAIDPAEQQAFEARVAEMSKLLAAYDTAAFRRKGLGDLPEDDEA